MPPSANAALLNDACVNLSQSAQQSHIMRRHVPGVSLLPSSGVSLRVPHSSTAFSLYDDCVGEPHIAQPNHIMGRRVPGVSVILFSGVELRLAVRWDKMIFADRPQYWLMGLQVEQGSRSGWVLSYIPSTLKTSQSLIALLASDCNGLRLIKSVPCN